MALEKKTMKIKRILKYSGIAVAVLIIGFLTVAQVAYQGIPQIKPPGKMYSVNGGEIHMHCTGPENNEQPTIIIISGAGIPSFVYSELQENLSETVRTCSYDPAGITWSKTNDIPFTPKNSSDELYQLLQAAQIEGPIILAGNGLGGITSLIYSAEHEEQVAGIAFIDSYHHDQVNRYGTEFREKMDKNIETLRANIWMMELAGNLGIMNMLHMSNFSGLDLEDDELEMMSSFQRFNPPYPAMKSMMSNIILSFEQGKEAHYDRRDLPIIAISTEGVIPDDSEDIEGISPEELRQISRDFNKDLADLSTSDSHVIVNGTSPVNVWNGDETADHILSLIPNIECVSGYQQIDAVCLKNEKIFGISEEEKTISELLIYDLKDSQALNTYEFRLG